MKLADLQVTGFVDLLASDAPAPGGGSASALEGALGVAMSAMVCSLTIGKKKYADYQDFAKESMEKALELKAKFVDVMDRDTENFNVVSAAFGLPKSTDEEKAARSKEIQKGLKGCTETPMEMMELACEALVLTHELVGKTNDSASSDLGCAALGLKSAIQGAWLNVKINLGSIKDAEFVETYQKKGEALLEKALPLADAIYNEVLATL